MLEDFEVMGAVWTLGAGALVVGVAPPTPAGEVVVEVVVVPALVPPADAPPVVATADPAFPTTTSMQNTIEHRARKRTATSFVGLRG
jgi:hypothetical protein